MSKKVKIHVQNASTVLDEHMILLGETYVKLWKIPTNQSLSLQFGAFRTQVKIAPVAKFDGIRMHASLANQMGIPHGAQLRMAYKSGTLQLGPSIGVLISRIYSSAEPPFGALNAYCKELIDACQAQGAFVFFFSPQEISAHQQSITGWTYAGHWYKSTSPIPNVVHNRLTTRKLENKPSVQQFFKEIKAKYGAQVFNEKYLNKTEVFQALRSDSSVTAYLPESYLFKNFQMLKSMCTKYHTVFLKPITGSLGKGIIRIRREAKGYTCHFTNVNGASKHSYSTLTKVFSALSSKLKSNRYQIQQGLSLIQTGGRNIDFRVLVQKDAQGKWTTTSSVGRIAGNNHFVSNLARGGSIGRVAEVVSRSNLVGSQRSSISARLKKAALDIAKAVETNIQGHFGELGIDLAVQPSGKVSLIEVNSKPSKNDNTPLEAGKIRPSVKRMIEYSRFLAGL